MSIIKYETGYRFHRCPDGQEDEMEMSCPEEDEIIECPLCGEGMQRADWDNANLVGSEEEEI